MRALLLLLMLAATTANAVPVYYTYGWTPDQDWEHPEYTFTLIVDQGRQPFGCIVGGVTTYCADTGLREDGVPWTDYFYVDFYGASDAVWSLTPNFRRGTIHNSSLSNGPNPEPRGVITEIWDTTGVGARAPLYLSLEIYRDALSYQEIGRNTAGTVAWNIGPTMACSGLSICNDFLYLTNISARPVPEPTTLLLLFTGLLGIWLLRSRARQPSVDCTASVR